MQNQMTPQDAVGVLGRAYQYVYSEATGYIWENTENIGPEIALLPYRVQDALNILQTCAMLIGKDERLL